MSRGHCFDHLCKNPLIINKGCTRRVFIPVDWFTSGAQAAWTLYWSIFPSYLTTFKTCDTFPICHLCRQRRGQPRQRGPLGSEHSDRRTIAEGCGATDACSRSASGTRATDATAGALPHCGLDARTEAGVLFAVARRKECRSRRAGAWLRTAPGSGSACLLAPRQLCAWADAGPRWRRRWSAACLRAERPIKRRLQSQHTSAEWRRWSAK